MTKPPNSSWNPRGESTEKEKTESKMRQRKRKKGSWSEYSGYFRCIHWPRLMWESDMKAGDTIRGVKLPSQPSAFTHETWTMKWNLTFSILPFFFSLEWKTIHAARSVNSIKTRQGEATKRKNAKETNIFALCYIYTRFSEVASAKIKILKLIAVNSRVDFFFCVRAARFLTYASLSCRSSCVPSEILFF